MRARAAVAVALPALALTAAAMAQGPAPPVGNFGGGRVVPLPADPQGAGNAVIGMRATPGKLQIEATLRGNCGGGTFSARTAIASDGSFLAKGTHRRGPEPGVRVKTVYEIAGTLTAGGVEQGTAKATNEIRVAGQDTVSCKSGPVSFNARRPSGQIGTPGAAPDARYFGVTSEKRHGVRRGIVLRVSSDAKTLRRALYAVTQRCNKGTLPADFIDTPRRNLKIDSKGRVKDRVGFTIRDGKTATRFEERFSGTLGSAGAKGTLSFTDRTTSRKTGKLLETCTTGSIRWKTAP